MKRCAAGPIRSAAGTSVVAAGALSLPTLAVHWQLGHIDWTVALVFGLGMLPLTGGRCLARPSGAD